MSAASCVGGIEFSLIHYHPIHGSKDIPLSEDEYRFLSAPYVATFETELYPGDLKHDLILEDTSTILIVRSDTRRITLADEGIVSR